MRLQHILLLGSLLGVLFKCNAIQAQTFFAEIDASGIVQRVIVADQAYIDSGAMGDPANWKQTYRDGTRKNYASVGFKYDAERDAFIPPRPYPSWELNEQRARWRAPVARPADASPDNPYEWDEANVRWKRLR